MAAKKLFPPRNHENPFGDDYDEVKLRIGFALSPEKSSCVSRIMWSGFA
jgi:hypothetical protein